MARLSFTQDIRPMFREMDIEEMKGVAGFDLSMYEDVCVHAIDIHSRVSDGSMPCDDPWSADQIAKFKQWIDDGMAA